MSRSGYGFEIDEFDGSGNLYRANVDRALAGKRGQKFLKEMLVSLEALPKKRLLAEVMQQDDEVCAIGSVGLARGMDMSELDPEIYPEMDFAVAISKAFKIAVPMAAEVMYYNDIRAKETPEERYIRMRNWIASHIKHTSEGVT